jgi:hypothetical protein
MLTFISPHDISEGPLSFVMTMLPITVIGVSIVVLIRTLSVLLILRKTMYRNKL